MDYELRIIVEKVAISSQEVIQRDTITSYALQCPTSIVELGLRHAAHNALQADYGSCSTYSMVSPLHPGHPIMGIPPVYSPRNVAAPIATSMMASLTSISSLQTGQR